MLGIIIRVMLGVTLLLGVVCAWRAWPRSPAIAGVGAVLALLAGVVLLRSPVLALLALTALGWLIWRFSRPHR